MIRFPFSMLTSGTKDHHLSTFASCRFANRKQMKSRSGFTLIELLVAMAIIIVLATLALLFTPQISSKFYIAKGADQLQEWLLTCRSRALRDQAPAGLHFLVDPTTNTISDIEWITQPEPFRPVVFNPSSGQFSPAPMIGVSSGSSGPPYLGINQVMIVGYAETGAINPGDLLEITSSGNRNLYRIMGVSPTANHTIISTTSPISELVGSGNFPGTGQPPVPTIKYRIIRNWRPLIGEPLVQLPKGIVINAVPSSVSIYTSVFPPVPGYNPSTGLYEPIILFNPNGSVQNGGSAPIIFYLDSNDGTNDPVLIAVYPRSGATAAHPVDYTGTDPFRFVKDGLDSGL